MSGFGRRVTPEGAVLSSARTLLRFHGWKVYRIQQAMGSHKGMTDLVAVKRGEDGKCRTVWVECKAPERTDARGHLRREGKLSPEQVQFRDEIRGEGGEHAVVSSLDDVAEYFGFKIIAGGR